MSSLGLVAYDGSGSSSEEDDEPMSETVVTVTDHKDNRIISGASSSSAPLAKSTVIFSKFLDDDDDDDVNDAELITRSVGDDANPVWSKFLPQPKNASTTEGAKDIQDIGPIPPKKTYGDEELPPPKQSSIPSLTTTKVQGKVRISIPFLNSLDEDDSAEGTEKKTLLHQPKKGSGLFALLPKPKNSMLDVSKMFENKDATRNKTQAVNKTCDDSLNQDTPQPLKINKLIPDSVKNKLKRPAAAMSDDVRAKYSKRSASASVSSKKDSDGSDDESAGDFFSLDSAETADPEALEKLKLPMPDFTKPQNVTTAEEMEVEESYNQGYHQEAIPSSSRSDDLMKFMQTRKGKKEDVQIIDVSADDLRPDNTEWLRNITDESAAPPRRGKGLGGMVKRKHQITYLAFEAKAREQELKNQWAQNRANKMATKNKYGF